MKVEEINDDRIKFIIELHQNVLESILKRWQKKFTPINNELLKMYYQMAYCSALYLPSPPLHPTWDNMLKKVDDAIKEFEKSNYFDDISVIQELIELIEIINDQEPRFLEYINFPKCLSTRINKVIEICVLESEAQEGFSVDSEDELYDLYIGESHRFERYERVITDLFDLNIDFEVEHDKDSVLDSIGGAAEYYSNMADEYSHPEPDYDRDYGRQEEISVSSLFSDL